jgi:hypothetical protein
MAQASSSDGKQRVPLLRRLGNLPVWAWILMAMVAYHLYSSWIFWIWGHFTPRMRWQGNALMTEPNGARYGLRIDFMAEVSPGNLSNNDYDGETIRGSGAFCAQHGQTGRWKLFGTVYDVWASTAGKQVRLSFSPETGPGQLLSVLRLSGHFDGDSIAIENSESPKNASQFAPGSLPFGDGGGARGRIEDADERAFARLCEGLRTATPK